MMYLVSVGRHKFYFTAAAWARTLFFFLCPEPNWNLRGKNVDDLSKIFRSTIKTKAQHSTRKKTLGEGKKRRELIRNDPRNRRHHQNERTFSPNSRRSVQILHPKTYFGYIREVFLFWTVVKANSRSKNIHYFFSTGSLVSMVYYKNTISTNKLSI